MCTCTRHLLAFCWKCHYYFHNRISFFLAPSGDTSHVPLPTTVAGHLAVSGSLVLFGDTLPSSTYAGQMTVVQHDLEFSTLSKPDSVPTTNSSTRALVPPRDRMDTGTTAADSISDASVDMEDQADAASHNRDSDTTLAKTTGAQDATSNAPRSTSPSKNGIQQLKNNRINAQMPTNVSPDDADGAGAGNGEADVASQSSQNEGEGEGSLPSSLSDMGAVAMEGIGMNELQRSQSLSQDAVAAAIAFIMGNRKSLKQRRKTEQLATLAGTDGDYDESTLPVQSPISYATAVRV